MKSIYIVITLSLLAFLLVSCDEVYTRPPQIDGNFNGSLVFESDKDTSIPFSMTLELGEVLVRSYTFSGSATLGTDTFIVSGEGIDDSQGNGFLIPQAAPPSYAELVSMTFENTTTNMKMCVEKGGIVPNYSLNLSVTNCEGEIVAKLQAEKVE